MQIVFDTMATPIIGLVPPGGWHYYTSDVKITGSTYPDLLKNVETYRAENNLQSNDVAGDVNSYICSNWPTFCHGVDMVAVRSVNAPTPSSELLNDIQTWAKNILSKNTVTQFVTDETAQARAITCLDCPNNVNWRGGCSSCINATDRLSASIRHGRDTKSTPVLGGCSLMRHDNRSAVFFDRDTFYPSANLPSNCWLNS